MKKIAITAALVALCSVSAVAADLGATKAPIVDPAYDWSGFYIGANAGYGWARNEHQDLGGNSSYWNDKSDVMNQTVDPRGAVYGGQFGYNWQAANWVFGLEGQFNGADVKRTDPSINYPDTDSLSSKIDSLGTVTARLGYAFNNWLPYIKGGYAAAHLETKNFALDNTYLSNRAWRSGYVVGAGVEYAFAANWIFGVEYNYMDFGGKTFSGMTFDPAGVPFNDEHFNDTLKLSTVTARLSYKFGGPFVAKY
ncbi:outer membrane immunogenic protein [Nitrobacteraceae bacterium AZCC 1564]